MSRNIFKTLIATAFLTTMQVLADTCVTTIAGSRYGYADGPALSAQFRVPYGVIFDQSGNLIIADAYDNRLRKLDTNGMVTTVAGNGSNSAIDGPALSATLNGPYNMIMDASGNIYFTDTSSNKLRKLSTNGNIITIAGSGSAGSTNGVGTNATFNAISGIVMDSNGNLFVSDTGNNMIRKVTVDGVVTTFAGQGYGASIDGNGTSALFDHPTGLAIDSSNNIYVAEYGSGYIRKITPDGVVTTVAGSSTIGYLDGPVLSARFYNPSAVAVDSEGTLFVADTGNNRVRMIKNGTVTTLAGDGSSGVRDGPGSQAKFEFITSIAIDSHGDLIIADTFSSRIRKVSMTACKSTASSTSTPTTSGISNNAYSVGMNSASIFAGIWSIVAISLIL